MLLGLYYSHLLELTPRRHGKPPNFDIQYLWLTLAMQLQHAYHSKHDGDGTAGGDDCLPNECSKLGFDGCQYDPLEPFS